MSNKKNAISGKDTFTVEHFKIRKNSIPTTAIAVRLEAAYGSSDFQRNSIFSLAYLTVFSECIRIFDKTGICLNIEQRSNIILGIFHTPAAAEINELFTVVSKDILQVISRVNTPKIEIKAGLFMDTGTSDSVHLIDNTSSTNKTLWLGNVIERTIKICNATALQEAPSILVTYNVYDKLDKACQDKFCNSYYFFHICCFGNYQIS